MVGRLRQDRWLPVLELCVLVATLFIANRFTSLCPFEIHKPVFWCENLTVASELPIYLMIVAAALVAITRRSLVAEWLRSWRRNGVLVAFLLVCFASTLWTESVTHSLYRALEVLCASAVASYLAVRYREADWIHIITWFAAVVIILSYLLVLLLPGAAIMSAPGLEGAWRGAFSHKNYAGSILAYCAAVLSLAMFLNGRRGERLGLGILLVLDVVFIYFSASATGALVLVFLLVFLAILLAWLRNRSRLQTPHYLAAGGAVISLALIAFLLRDRVLAVVGRSSTLTGRVPLWEWVISQVRSHNVWLGYGLWTVWRFPEFTTRAGIESGWPYPIIDAHNGYLDVLLYLGVVGLAVFLALIGRTIWVVAAYVKEKGSVESLWLAMTLAYVLVANVTISFFFQFETFHWLLLIVVLFEGTGPRAKSVTPATA